MADNNPASDLSPASSLSQTAPALSPALPPELLSYPAHIIEHVRALLEVMRDIDREGRAALDRHATSHEGQPGWAVASLDRKYRNYQKDGWTAFIDKRKWKELQKRREDKLPAAFVEHWKTLCQQNNRACSPARRLLIRQWQEWRLGGPAIPGYVTCPPPAPGQDVPAGWHYRNLIRYKPSKFELTAVRIGRAAASEYRPLVLTTRVGLQVGQYYQFDDMWHDFKVAVYGQTRPQRLLQFSALDLFSACNFARGLRPVMDVDGAEKRLNESEMIFLVAHVLTEFGYRPEGTVLCVERGTAAIREPIEQLLYDLTHGAVRVERNGMTGKAAWPGAYDGPGRGNFRFKAALESLHSLIHNETADIALIPGQTGSNSRINAPADLTGREKDCQALLAAIAALPPELAALLRLQFMEYNQSLRVVNAIIERINARTEHALEGWIESGLTCVEQRGAGILPVDVRVRKLSPREVFDAGRAGLVKLDPAAAALLLAQTAEPERLVRVQDNHTITFQSAALSPSLLHYYAHDLTPGEQYRATVNPYDLSRCYLFDARGKYAGFVERQAAVSRADTDALHRAMGRARKIESALLQPVAARGAALTRARLENARHNAAVLTRAALPDPAPDATPAERARAAEVMSEIFSAEQATPDLPDLSQRTNRANLLTDIF